MTDVRTAHTADLDAATLAATRALLDLAFAGGFSDDDWDHSLGGIHALAYEGDEVIAHAAVVRRQFQHGGRPLQVGYVEGVGVHPERRRLGHANAVMEAVERFVRGGYDLGALSATDDGARVYTARGWEPWRGPLSSFTATGVKPTEDEPVYVLTGSAPIDIDGELTCDWRDGDIW